MSGKVSDRSVWVRAITCLGGARAKCRHVAVVVCLLDVPRAVTFKPHAKRQRGVQLRGVDELLCSVLPVASRIRLREDCEKRVGWQPHVKDAVAHQGTLTTLCHNGRMVACGCIILSRARRRCPTNLATPRVVLTSNPIAGIMSVGRNCVSHPWCPAVSVRPAHNPLALLLGSAMAGPWC